MTTHSRNDCRARSITPNHAPPNGNSNNSTTSTPCTCVRGNQWDCRNCDLPSETDGLIGCLGRLVETLRLARKAVAATCWLAEDWNGLQNQEECRRDRRRCRKHRRLLCRCQRTKQLARCW